jgi:hypothetical protein
MLEHCLGLRLGATEVDSDPYLATSRYNIEIPLEWSHQLTGFRLIEIWSGGRTVVQCKLNKFFRAGFRSWLGLSSH